MSAKKAKEELSEREAESSESIISETGKASPERIKPTTEKKKAESPKASKEKNLKKKKEQPSEEAERDASAANEAQTAESEGESTDSAATARQAILTAFQTQAGGVAAGGVGADAATITQQTKNGQHMPKKTLTLIIVGAVFLVGAIAAVLLISHSNTSKREQAVKQQYNQQVEAQGQRLAGIYQQLEDLQSREGTLVAQIDSKATANRTALTNWDTTWQNQIAKYNSDTQAVTTYNDAEDAKSSQVVGTWTDPNGYNIVQYYEPKHKDYPAFPTPPQKITTDFSAESNLAATLQAKAQALQSEVASDSFSSFPFAQKSISDVLTSILGTASDAQSVLSSSNFLSEAYYQDNSGSGDSIDKGEKVNAQQVATLTTQRTSDLMASFKQDFDTALTQNNLTPADVGISGNGKQTTVGNATPPLNSTKATTNPSTSPKGSAQYVNQRYGFGFDYSSDLVKMGPAPTNDDGRNFLSLKTGQEIFTVSGSHNALDDTIDSLYAQSLKDASAEGFQITYQKKNGNTCTISGESKDKIIYERIILISDSGGGRIITAYFLYPISEKATWNTEVDKVIKSLRTDLPAEG